MDKTRFHNLDLRIGTMSLMGFLFAPRKDHKGWSTPSEAARLYFFVGTLWNCDLGLATYTRQDTALAWIDCVCSNPSPYRRMVAHFVGKPTVRIQSLSGLLESD